VTSAASASVAVAVLCAWVWARRACPFITKVETEALACGHTFHTCCVEQAVIATRKPKGELCPFRCHQSVAVVPETDAHLVDEEAPGRVDGAAPESD
jgi:hypothetical protein